MLGGYAGTGKTTVIKEISKRLRDLPDEERKTPNICAYTGKAVSVLIRKGLVHSRTLHSLMYKPIREDDKIIGWERVADILGDMTIVDEASMINTELYRDLCSFKKKILFVGDIGQLEPVGDNPYIMATPDLTLTEIHRQAALSPIVQFSVILRNGAGFSYGSIGDALHIVPKSTHSNYMYDVDQVICGLNATRHAFNSMIRTKKGFSATIEEGDRLICLKNDKNRGIYNGLMANVTRVHDTNSIKKIVCTLRTEDGTELPALPIYRAGLGANIPSWDMKTTDLTFWDYGYAITAHKAQGSEWDTVMVYEESVGSWDYRRWTYTAATRAAKKLIYCR